MRIISYDASSRGPEVAALGEWLESINLNPMTIKRVEIDVGKMVATIHTKHGMKSDFKLAKLPIFITYRIEGLAPCGHHPEDSFGIAYCMACRAKRKPWDGKRGLK